MALHTPSIGASMWVELVISLTVVGMTSSSRDGDVERSHATTEVRL
jgi:hypothetical protein